MSAEFVVYLLMGAFAGGFINGLSGSGTALFALGFYLMVLDPIRAVAIVALMSVLAGLQGLWIVRDEIFAQPRRLFRFLVPGLLGVPLGLSLLVVIDAGALRIAIAVMLILYGGYFGFRASLPAFTRTTPWIDSLIGLVGGVLGGAASVSGAFPAMWLSLRPWTKAETRAVLQPYNVAILTTTVSLLFFRGAYDDIALTALLITVPCGLIAAQIGIAVFHQLSDTGFRRLLIILTLLMGLGILASEIL
ncbi:sulfite exporter TauE/SafE family protein [Ruegeria arenilitoris]|uniref:sulfite exporter TauE/SafE family protein n=1 Tax=Ruegeria arenilitoris TaxID=1173585 RepID=UPI00147D6406|nr:sulfite exporter TauE/SafE family protein [Ruegeria arenilitoris]